MQERLSLSESFADNVINFLWNLNPLPLPLILLDEVASSLLPPKLAYIVCFLVLATCYAASSTSKETYGMGIPINHTLFLLPVLVWLAIVLVWGIRVPSLEDSSFSTFDLQVFVTIVINALVHTEIHMPMPEQDETE